ncbi:amidophosphoribosyltransferase [Candidatus Pseudoscillospira sp. SGI.172]|uniref:amidophosphoribosyltransferase n=1 Tax=Candidatus Pseudoscillospira sp. SGI.172 TaxID=3420582 RepID=UPI0009BBB091|nr:amidophosphoribosyltransferase [Pseudoflavonifractor sp.]MDY3020533.1 amidophosphoribosyltransferase [Oscillospiraceae bacterium]
MEPIWDKLHEECGVLGIYDAGDIEDIISDTYYGLYALQHRGQESCGVAVNDDGVIQLHKDVGLVSEVFARDVLERLPRGKMTVGHCRYATTGTRNAANAQPLVVRHVKGSMALAHNGNLTNAARLRRDYELQGAIFHSTSDTEVIAYTITRQRLRTPSIQEAVVAAMSELQGAYSLVIMSPRKLIAARDPMGFRPLCMGRLGESVVFASESCALDAIGAHFVRDIDPGEVVVVSDGGSVESIRTHCQGAKRSFCVFEYIYFARPDSVIDGSAVHTARQRAGALLALSHPAQADVVVGVPDSGLDAALGYAQQSGIPYGIGFLKNKYIGRTFIAPNQKQRENDVRIKLNPIAATVRGKRVVLVDDSIVRGTTSLKIVRLLREAGAAEVHMRLSAPPFRYPCYFGTDIDSSENLIAFKHSVEEIAEMIGVDSLGYLPVEDLPRLPEGGCTGLCDACFTGVYPVEPPQPGAKSRFETKFSENTGD